MIPHSLGVWLLVPGSVQVLVVCARGAVGFLSGLLHVLCALTWLHIYTLFVCAQLAAYSHCQQYPIIFHPDFGTFGLLIETENLAEIWQKLLCFLL